MASLANDFAPEIVVAESTSESRRNASRRTALLVLGGCLLIWFLRRPEQLFHPYLWDEESQVIRHFLSDGWLGAQRPVNGYFNLPATLLVPLAATISFAHLPVLAFWMATAVFALTVWMLVIPDSRWGNQNTRACMAFAVSLCPTNPETFGVLLYSFWWATLWPVIILGWKRDLWWARVPLLIVASLSSPAGALMAVPFAVAYRLDRRRPNLAAVCILTGGLVLQLTSLMTGARNGTVLSTSLLAVLAQSLRTVGLFVVWWAEPAHVYWQLNVLLGLALLGALAAIVNALRRRQKMEPLLLLIALVLFTGLSAAPAPMATNPQDIGPRYYFLPFVLLSWIMLHLWRESELQAPIRVIAGILVATSILGIWTTFSRSPTSTTGRLNWQQEIVLCAVSNTPIVQIPVYFDGSAQSLWSIGMTPAECRSHLQ